jgi:hypothetical protein
VSIYVTTSAEEVLMERWSIRESDKGSRHFVGRDVVKDDGRVSTPIQSFDPVTRTGVTASGSTYQLVGRAGRDADAEYVWNIASRAWGYETWTDITADLVPDWRNGLSLSKSESSTDTPGEQA